MTAVLASRADVLPGIRIADVIVGERARKDYGDLTDLIESIREVGLLQPIGLTPGNRLLFGGRRLEACRALGWESIPFVRPATREDALSLLTAERDENTCRKEMTLSELVDLGRRIEELVERPAARERQGTRTDLQHSARPIGMLRDTIDKSANESRRRVGDALGISGATYERAKKVIAVAEDETAPEETRAVARDAVKEMDATGKAWGPFQKVREAREKQPAKNNLALPRSPQYGGGRRKHREVLQAMTTTLAGLAGAAEEITELDTSVTQEEATQLVRDLSRQIRSLNQIRNLLKERIR